MQLITESKQSTNRANGRDSVYFGQTLLWPVSRPIDDRDVLELSAYNYRKHLPGSRGVDTNEDINEDGYFAAADTAVVVNIYAGEDDQRDGDDGYLTRMYLLGTITINLFSLTRENRMALRENLVDGSNRPTSMVLSFEVIYQSPDSKIGDLEQHGLDYPITPMDYGLQGGSMERRSISQMEAG
ncbi:hypothetical protein AHF37_10864 [Paragonimus kellicotti]|nr:hypothetical protein AHF37_10864 [Paragonimus kellicotti]